MSPSAATTTGGKQQDTTLRLLTLCGLVFFGHLELNFTVFCDVCVLVICFSPSTLFQIHHYGNGSVYSIPAGGKYGVGESTRVSVNALAGREVGALNA